MEGDSPNPPQTTPPPADAADASTKKRAAEAAAAAADEAKRQRGATPEVEEVEEVEEEVVELPPAPTANGSAKKGTTTWVQCDACEKWRRLPADGIALPDNWTCALHPVASQRSCEIPQEDLDEEEDVEVAAAGGAKGGGGKKRRRAAVTNEDSHPELPGWLLRHHTTHAGRTYVTYHGPAGQYAKSLAAARAILAAESAGRSAPARDRGVGKAGKWSEAEEGILIAEVRAAPADYFEKPAPLLDALAEKLPRRSRDAVLRRWEKLELDHALPPVAALLAAFAPAADADAEAAPAPFVAPMAPAAAPAMQRTKRVASGGAAAAVLAAAAVARKREAAWSPMVRRPRSLK